MAAHPKHNAISDRPEYGQIYMLDTEDTVGQRLNLPANLTSYKQHQALNRELVETVEIILRNNNAFAQSFQCMHEVEKQVNDQARAARITPPKVKLRFSVDKQADVCRYNMPTTSEVATVLILNPDGSIPYVVVTHPKIDINMEQATPRPGDIDIE